MNDAKRITQIKDAIAGKTTATFSDRYSAAGIPRPDPQTMCDECEGMGFHPMPCKCGGTLAAHKPDKDLTGWCFVSPCQACMGTRLRRTGHMSAENADAAIKRLAKYADLPDGWIFAGTDICIGDMRALAAEVIEVRALLTDKRRAELIQMSAAVAASGSDAPNASTIVDRAWEILEEVTASQIEPALAE